MPAGPARKWWETAVLAGRARLSREEHPPSRFALVASGFHSTRGVAPVGKHSMSLTATRVSAIAGKRRGTKVRLLRIWARFAVLARRLLYRPKPAPRMRYPRSRNVAAGT